MEKLLQMKEEEQVVQDLKDFALSWHMAMCPTTTTTTTTTTTSRREYLEGDLEALEELELLGNSTLLGRMGGNGTEEEGGFFDGPPWSWFLSGSAQIGPLRIEICACSVILICSLFK